LLDRDLEEPGLLAATRDEGKRIVASRLERERRRTRFDKQLTANHLNDSDLFRAKVLVEGGSPLPPDWANHTAKHELHIVREPWEATLFVAVNPFAVDFRLKFAATLVGAFVVNPATITRAGNAVIFKGGHALAQKRLVWVSPGFKAAHPHLWIMLLELLLRQHHKWTLLAGAREWAAAKAKLMPLKRAAEVIALISDDEYDANSDVKHVYTRDTFLGHFGKLDLANSAIGLLDM
jgi:hypothetical protein